MGMGLDEFAARFYASWSFSSKKNKFKIAAKNSL